MTPTVICWELQASDSALQAIQTRLLALEPGFGGRVGFRFGCGGEIALRSIPAPAGRSLTAYGPDHLVEPLWTAAGRQLRPWAVRPARCPSGPACLEAALAEGDESRPHLLDHLAEGIVLGLAGALGERFSFPVSPETYEQRDLTLPARLTPGELERRLAGTGLAGLGEAFCQAEVEGGINSLALAAMAAWQSVWGSARIAREHRNLLGKGACSEAPGGACSEAPGGAGPDGGSPPAFPTAAESIIATAPRISAEYLSPGGAHFYGPNLIGMNVAYASDPLWRHGVAGIWMQLAGD